MRGELSLVAQTPRSAGHCCRGRQTGTWGAAVLLGLLVWSGPSVLLPARAAAQTQDRAEKSAVEPPEPKLRSRNPLLSALQDAFSEIADEVEPAVVTVLSTKSPRPADDENSRGPFRRGHRRHTGTGSGVILSKDGWVLTNDHVIGSADTVMIRLHDGREFPGIVRRDIRSDIALVKISASVPLPVVRLGDSDKVKVGHWAIAIGSPYRYEGSLSVGVISSLHRRQQVPDPHSPTGFRLYPNMIQTDAAINPGNSGGPLCNLDGEVIAINTAIESEGGGSVGIGFAIPINAAKFVIPQLRDKGRVSYGYLGINPATVTPAMAEQLKVDYGALVEADPSDDSPAARAGLHAGDVVTQIDSRPCRDEIDLRTIVGQTAPGTTLNLTVAREGQRRVVKVTLTEAADLTPASNTPVVKARLGIEVQSITERLAQQASVPTNTPGVVIKAIDPAGPAAEREDLFEGVVILKVNAIETPTVQAFQSATAGLKSGDKVQILYQRSKEKRIVFLTID